MARDPVVLVHGYLGRAADWDQMKGWLRDAGWAENEVWAIALGDTNTSVITLARDVLAPYVETVLQQTGRTRVDMVGHSLGAVVGRYYVRALGGGTRVRDFVSVAGSQHGTQGACLTTSLGDSSRQLCPAYAAQQDSVDSVQWDLNGDPDSADVDETPFGIEDGGGVSWSAIAYARDLIISPHTSSCLDQASRGDCSAPINTVVDWDNASHINLIKDERLVPLLVERLDAHGP